MIAWIKRAARAARQGALVAVLGASAVLSFQPGTASANPEGTLTWGVHVSLAPTFFDPAEATGTALPLMVYYALHDALVRPITGNAMGNSLAESWSAGRDGLTYEFVLRKNARFHNGDPVTADDVKFSFERYKGASATLLKSKVAAVEVVDQQRVRFRLKEVWPDFMTFYGTPATGAGWIVPRKYIEKVGDEGFKRAPVGAGPYKFVSFKPGVELVLEAFDGYWRKSPNVKTLVLRVIPDDATRLAALKRGEIDIAYGIVGPLAEEVRKTTGLKLKSAAIPVTLWLQFTEQSEPKSPWADARVRLAASLAIDRKAINDASYLGLGKLSASIIPQAHEFYWNPPPIPHDPARAKKLLAEAGFANGFDAGELSAEPFAASGIGEAVVNDLNAVGIRIKLRPIERAAFLKQHAEKKLKGVVLAGSGSPGNAATRIEQYVAGGGQYVYAPIAEVDKLYREQAGETRREVRAKSLESIQRLLSERSVFAPIIEYAYLVSVGPRVEFDALNAIPANPYTAPYEDLRITRK
ncbi:MAG: ABC transporter substrate-binding protein [Burkholderiales bacterium]|nr:ABC transporter substrate-binding protein [Burkholderiales bacterium]